MVCMVLSDLTYRLYNLFLIALDDHWVFLTWHQVNRCHHLRNWFSFVLDPFDSSQSLINSEYPVQFYTLVLPLKEWGLCGWFLLLWRKTCLGGVILGVLRDLFTSLGTLLVMFQTHLRNIHPIYLFKYTFNCHWYSIPQCEWV